MGSRGPHMTDHARSARLRRPGAGRCAGAAAAGVDGPLDGRDGGEHRRRNLARSAGLRSSSKTRRGPARRPRRNARACLRSRPSGGASLITQQDMSRKGWLNRASATIPGGTMRNSPTGRWPSSRRGQKCSTRITSEQPTWIELLPKIMAPGLLITGDPDLMTIINPDWASQAAAAGRASRWCGSRKRATTSATTISTNVTGVEGFLERPGDFYSFLALRNE